MITKYSSPMIKSEARRSTALLYSRPRSSILGEYGDLMMVMIFCFTVYALFLYFVLPTVSSSRYARASAELSYHWRNVWYFVEYQFYTAFLPAAKSLLQDLLVLLPR